ncbi:MFS transporter [Actinotalea sp. M2MS4P-6]|uniref:MFS transporter n=1 Tax=Actinotalea sp. M2MS4P-6 TaxID=2983762 RepID=UPI0021E4A5AB|nr:MFS transporter [Actinotalea sp. M2MS4P-6]MCV2394764.1 MFS transporter [Actinotalea sp. M2MS4P-6]
MNTPHHPRYRWFVLASLVLITTAGAMSMIAPAPFVGLVSEDLGISLGAAVATTMMTVMLTTSIVAFLSGFVIDRVGFPIVWVFGCAMQIVAALAIGPLSHSTSGLVIGRILTGIGMGPINAVIATVCAQWFRPRERSYVAAAQGVSMWLGISIGLLWTPHWFAVFGDWHRALTMSAIPPAVGLVLALAILVGPKPPVSTVAETVEHRAATAADMKRSLATRAIWVLFVMALFEAWFQQAYNDMAPGFYAVDPPVGLGLGPVGAGQALTWAGYASIVGTILAPFVVDRLFKGNPKLPLMIACTVSAVFTMGMHVITKDSGAALILLPCAMLLFSSIVNPTIYGYIANHYPSTVSGRLGGTATSLAGFGSFLGLAVGSAALALTGYYTVSMNVLAAVILISGIASLLIKEPGLRAPGAAGPVPVAAEAAETTVPVTSS